MLGPQDIKKIELESPTVNVEPTITKDGEIAVSSEEGTNFLKGKINEILGGDLKSLSDNDLELNKILEWAQEKGAKSLEDVLWEVRDLANHLGTPGYGESRLKFLYQYVYLLNEDKVIKAKLKKMEGYGK